MNLRRGLLLGCAATLFAQDFTPMEKPEIDMAIAEAKRALDQLKHTDLAAAAKAGHEAAMRAQRELMANEHLLARVPEALMFAKEALSKSGAAFAYHQIDPKGDNTPLSDDEQLKMMAIDTLMHSQPDRAIPLLDKLVQNQGASMRLRMRALEALGNSSSPAARDIVVRVAKDSSNPQLQSRAVQLLYSRNRRGSADRQMLRDIYASSTNKDIRRQILRQWASFGEKDQLLAVAKSDSDPDLRANAIRHLGGMRATAELASLYPAESSVEIRERILRALAGADDWQMLIEIAKTEKDEKLRTRAIQYAAHTSAPGVSEALVEIYNSVPDASTRSAILRALADQGNAKQVIALARKEPSLELKRDALRHLSRMKSDDVTAYLSELLEK